MRAMGARRGAILIRDEREWRAISSTPMLGQAARRPPGDAAVYMWSGAARRRVWLIRMGFADCLGTG